MGDMSRAGLLNIYAVASPLAWQNKRKFSSTIQVRRWLRRQLGRWGGQQRAKGAPCTPACLARNRVAAGAAAQRQRRGSNGLACKTVGETCYFGALHGAALFDGTLAALLHVQVPVKRSWGVDPYSQPEDQEVAAEQVQAEEER